MCSIIQNNLTLVEQEALHFVLVDLKDTHREKPPSNKIPVLTKSMNMDIWVVGTSNQFFLKSS